MTHRLLRRALLIVLARAALGLLGANANGASSPPFVPDTHQFTAIEVSVGNVDKTLDPRTGGPCDQRCRLARIFTRLNYWTAAANYLQDIAPGDAELKNQLSCSQGLCFVLGEIQFENLCQALGGCTLPDGSRPTAWPPDGHTSEKSGVWSEGPDYDFFGNVQPRLIQLGSRIMAVVNANHLQPPAEDIRQALDLEIDATGKLVRGNKAVKAAKPTALTGPCLATRCKGGNKACTADADCKFDASRKNFGPIDTGAGCQPLTPAQDRALQDLLDSHHANGEWRKAHNGQPRPGGAAEFFAAGARLESLSRKPDEQALFFVWPFPNIERITRPQWQRDMLEDKVHADMLQWATAIRNCPKDPVYQRTVAFTAMHLHRDDHTDLATDFGALLPLRRPCWPDKKAGISLQGALTLDGCPNSPWPPPGYQSAPFMGTAGSGS